MKVELDRECKSCGMKLKQHVSFSENNGRITIKVYRYKCPFCDTFITEPVVEEIKKAIRKESVWNGILSCLRNKVKPNEEKNGSKDGIPAFVSELWL